MRILFVSFSGKNVRRSGHLAPLVRAASTPYPFEVAYLDGSKEKLEPSRGFFDFAVLSFETPDADAAFALSRELRLRGTKTLAMGTHPTFRFEECAAAFDSVLTGEPEGAWEEVLQDLAEHGELEPYYDCPPDHAFYGKSPGRRSLVSPPFSCDVISSSQGCRYRCAHCQIPPFFHGAVRLRPIPAFIEEAAPLGKQLFLGDSNLYADPLHARELLGAMRSLDRKWIVRSSIDLAFDRHLLALAREAKVKAVQVCLDSFSKESLLSINNRHSCPERYGEAIARFHEQGILVAARLSFGLDFDGADAFERALGLSESLGIDLLLPRIVPPLPGTEFYRRLLREDRILERGWSDFDGRHAVFSPLGMGAKELEEGYLWIRRELQRIRSRLRRLRLGSLGLLAASELPFQGC